MSVNKKNSDGSYNQYASKPYVTKDNIGLSRVENKNSEDIRGEITSKNVTDALGYTPVNPNPEFIYDTEAKMTKVIPENVNKGVVAMIGGKTVKRGNLWDEQWTNGNYSPNTGRPVTSPSSNVRNLNHIPVKPNTTYTFVHTSDTYRRVFWTADMQLVSSIGGLSETVFTTPDDAYFMDFNMDGAYGDTYKNDTALYEGEIKDAVYGMGWLDNAPVDKITINNKVIPIPSEILNLPDYGFGVGDVYNYVDFEEMVYHHKVGSAAMKDHLPSSWSYIDNSKRYYATSLTNLPNMKKPAASSELANVVFNNYNVKSWSNNIGNVSFDKTMYFAADGGVSVRNLAATTAEQLNSLLQDTVLNYELAEEELIPLTDLLLPFKCEPGGTVTFENEHNLDVPNTVIYEKEMK